MKNAIKRRSENPPRGFDELNRLFPLRPLADDVDLDNATEVANRLAVLDRRTKDQEDYLETLSLLIEHYEDEHYGIETRGLDPVGTLKFLMEQHNMSAGDIGRILGNRQLGVSIVRGSRQLSKSNILALAKHFNVGVGSFLKEYA